MGVYADGGLKNVFFPIFWYVYLLKKSNIYIYIYPAAHRAMSRFRSLALKPLFPKVPLGRGLPLPKSLPGGPERHYRVLSQSVWTPPVLPKVL